MSVWSRAVWASCNSLRSCCCPPRAYTRARLPHTRTWHCRRCPSDPSDLYNLTKLAGEALCLADPRPDDPRGATVQCVRHRHAGGDVPGTGAARGECHRKRGAPRSCRVRQGLCQCRSGGTAAAGNRHRRRVPNLQPRRRQQHQPRRHRRRLHDIAGWHIGFTPDAPTVRYPPIDTARLDTEFGPPAAICQPTCRPC